MLTMELSRSWIESLQSLGQDLYSRWQYQAMPEPDLSATNPWRDLPIDAAVHDTLREILWISNTLTRGMIPTSLPGDDYQLYSDLLYSLETRGDVTYLVLGETGVETTVMALAGRGGIYQPIPDEPFDLDQRLKALHSHWREWMSKENAPNKWDKAFDTAVIPPLLLTDHRTDDTFEDGSISKRPPKVEMTGEQSAEADRLYSEYAERRTKAVSYLKRHPPRPMGFAPIKQDEAGSREAWGSLYPDGQIHPNRPADQAKLYNNVRWKPLYRRLTDGESAVRLGRSGRARGDEAKEP